MDIRNTRTLKASAGEQLNNAPQGRKVVLIYAGLTVGISALVTVINYCLGLQIDQSGGLSNIGTRSLLATVQNILPLAQSLFLMCLDLGYLAAMLRVARGQYTSPNTLRLGIDRFGPLLRMSLLLGFLYGIVFFACAFLVSMIYGVLLSFAYVMTMSNEMAPQSGSVLEILEPMMTESADPTAIVMSMDEATLNRLAEAMTPVLVIVGILVCLIILPISFFFRMANYVIIDRPGCGAIAAMRESCRMMKGNILKMLRLDLSFWWYYLLLLAAALVCYGDQYLPLLGVELPGSAQTWSFVFLGLFLVMEFAIYYFTRNRVEVTYALAYDAIRPKEEKQSGVVLGNIFNM